MHTFSFDHEQDHAMNRTIRLAALSTAGISTALALAACGSTGSSSSSVTDQNMPGMTGMSSSSSATTSPATPANPAAAPHNAADVAFATGMIPHHGQAITMADMATSKATNPQVQTLAAAIKTAQGPEITTMSGWLTGWGQPVPSTTGGQDMAGMGTGSNMGGMSGEAGMMSEQEMQQLSATTGAQFDRMWLQMMIKHHQGAVTMARTEVGNGQHPDAKQLAQRIIAAQNTEIATMTALLPSITG